MGRLKDKIRAVMELKNFSHRTIYTYLHSATGFVSYYGKSPEELGVDEIQKYLHYLKVEKALSASSVNQAYSALKILYTYVLKRKWENTIPRVKRPKKLPEILSRGEVKALLSVTNNLKHCMMLKVLYGTGMRVGEVSRLKLNNIDSKRMLIRVDQGKGNKDRNTLLSTTLLNDLRKYWLRYQPMTWLFENGRTKNHISSSTIQRVFSKAKDKAGITRNCSTHSLRHSFATHLLEQGVDLVLIQRLLGHSCLQTTTIYLHVQNNQISKIINPLDCL